MNRINCVNCGSENVIHNAQVQDLGAEDGLLKVRIDEYPQALLFKGTVVANLRARICGACGYTEFYVDDPEQMYETYLRAQKAEEERR